MKNKSYIGISLIVLIFGIWTVKELRSRLQKNNLHNVGPAPSFSFTNQNNKTISNKNYEDKVYVVEFFFSSCTTICPRMNENMLQLQKEFYGNLDFGIASFTIDPERDTPTALLAHANKLGVKNPNWHFLTGKESDLMKLGNEKFKLYADRNPNIKDGFEHSGLFALIDKDGNIRSRKDSFGNPIIFYDGLEQSGIDALKQDIKILLEE
jgi:protein SCO1